MCKGEIRTDENAKLFLSDVFIKLHSVLLSDSRQFDYAIHTYIHVL